MVVVRSAHMWYNWKAKIESAAENFCSNKIANTMAEGKQHMFRLALESPVF